MLLHYTVVPNIAMTKLINPTTAKLCNYARLPPFSKFRFEIFFISKTNIIFANENNTDYLY
ncbi:hypothetical protein IMSAG192_01048 [Muribaculaceae bacterium]|nr:hypothetical protein IMSAG192_01048 [Muribaculaceae bacterium]